MSSWGGTRAPLRFSMCARWNLWKLSQVNEAVFVIVCTVYRVKAPRLPRSRLPGAGRGGAACRPHDRPSVGASAVWREAAASPPQPTHIPTALLSGQSD